MSEITQVSLIEWTPNVLVLQVLNKYLSVALCCSGLKKVGVQNIR